MSKPRNNDIPIAYLREAFDLDPTSPSGLRWRERPRKHFATKRAWNTWNTRYAGRAAKGHRVKGYFQILVTIDEQHRALSAHRVSWALEAGEHPPDQIDHARGVEGGNGVDNLRKASQSENNQNRKTNRNNWSGYPGVTRDRGRSKWRAGIAVGGRAHRFGGFDTPEAAFMERCDAKARFHPFAPEHRGLSPQAATVAERARVRRKRVAGWFMRGARDWRRA